MSDDALYGFMVGCVWVGCWWFVSAWVTERRR